MDRQPGRVHPWLPDALAIRVEYLARNGRHPEALKLLMDIPQAGVPLFRSGIGYLADRARLTPKWYLEGRSDLSLSDTDQERLRQIALVFSELAIAGHEPVDQRASSHRSDQIRLPARSCPHVSPRPGHRGRRQEIPRRSVLPLKSGPPP